MKERTVAGIKEKKASINSQNEGKDSSGNQRKRGMN
jgi:hypothetical protein